MLDDGALALVPLSTVGLGDDERIWVRNGMGQTIEASVRRGDRALTERGLVLLMLRAPLPTGASRQSAARAPFAGSPGYAVTFGKGSEPAWPTLTQGFFGSPVGDTEVRRLGFGAAAGAPVMDRGGALAGIAVGEIDGRATWLPLSALTSVAGLHDATIPSAPVTLRLVAPDEIYEAGLRRALQVLVDERP